MVAQWVLPTVFQEYQTLYDARARSTAQTFQEIGFSLYPTLVMGQ
jgi:hypothetical protein